MPNRKLTDLDELISADVADIVAIVDDSDGNLLTKNKYITVGNLLAGAGSALTVVDTGAFSESDVETIRFPAGSVSLVSAGFVEIAVGEPYVEINSTAAFPTATGVEGIAIGGSATAAGAQGIAIGISATTNDSSDSIVIGNNANIFEVGTQDIIAIGNNASGNRDYGVAIGQFARAHQAGGIAIGRAATVDDVVPTYVGSIAIGDGVGVLGQFSTAVGLTSSCDGSDAVAIGHDARGSGENGIAVGHNAQATDTDAIAIGDNAQATNVDALALGDGADCFAEEGIAIGEGATTGSLSTHAIAIGKSAEVGIGNLIACTNSTAIGVDCTTQSANSLVVGSSTDIVAGATDSIAIGHNNSWTEDHPGSICIGSGNQMAAGGAFVQDNIVIGSSITCQGGRDNILIGTNPRTPPSGDHSGNIILGYGTLHQSSGDDSIVIGNNIEVSSSRCIAIGDNADIDTTSDDSIAIGTTANIDATSAVQIGAGTNTADSTFQFLANRLANAEGLYTSFTTPTYYTPVDDDNVTSHLQAIDGALEGYVNEDVTSAVDVTVTPGVSNNRIFITPTANINLIVETAGATNRTYFQFINVDPGGGDIDIKIDAAGNPTVLTLNAATNNVSCAYTGTDYRFWA